ncbi:MAG: hypothetical protein HHJ12_00865 [Glaciimonas sp.]|nr:hypothetical protein [Glaciimonas sp.]
MTIFTRWQTDWHTEVEAGSNAWLDDLEVGRDIEVTRREQAVVAYPQNFLDTGRAIRFEQSHRAANAGMQTGKFVDANAAHSGCHVGWVRCLIAVLIRRFNQQSRLVADFLHEAEA